MAASTAPASDLKALMAASPAFRLLPESDLATLISAVDFLTPERHEEIVGILKNEQKQLHAIREEYDQKRKKLFQEYIEKLKTEEKKMVSGFAKALESVEHTSEDKTLHSLLNQLNKL